MQKAKITPGAAIYTIRCKANGKIYVGSTSNISQRHSTHFQNLKSGAHHSKEMQEDYKKYGEDGFVFKVVKYVPYLTEYDRKVKEHRLIKKYFKKTYNVNLVPPLPKIKKRERVGMKRNLQADVSNLLISFRRRVIKLGMSYRGFCAVAGIHENTFYNMANPRLSTLQIIEETLIKLESEQKNV